MLIATPGFTNRNTQHYNAITAARQAGVEHIALTSILRKEGSGFILPQATVTNIFMEQTAKASGILYTIVRQSAFMEVMPLCIGERASEVGVRVPAGSGKVGPATRDNIARGPGCDPGGR